MPSGNQSIIADYQAIIAANDEALRTACRDLVEERLRSKNLPECELREIGFKTRDIYLADAYDKIAAQKVAV